MDDYLLGFVQAHSGNTYLLLSADLYRPKISSSRRSVYLLISLLQNAAFPSATNTICSCLIALVQFNNVFLGSTTDKSDHRQLILALVKSQPLRTTLLQQRNKWMTSRNRALLILMMKYQFTNCHPYCCCCSICPIVSSQRCWINKDVRPLHQCEDLAPLICISTRPNNS
jgi:hypothetical protein